MNNRVSALIVAAGKGSRMNSDIPKQYLKLKDKEILAYTIEKFENNPLIDNVVLVVSKNQTDYCKENIINKYNFKKIYAVVEGGNERNISVYNGLKALHKDTETVLIHDGVRPFIDSKIISEIINKTEIFDACVLGVKVKDTIKICDSNNNIVDTPDRNYIWAAQTPQAFKYNLILKAYDKIIADNKTVTDDSMAAEYIGLKVKMIEGNYNNIKITTPEDLSIAEAILLQQADGIRN